MWQVLVFEGAATSELIGKYLCFPRHPDMLSHSDLHSFPTYLDSCFKFVDNLKFKDKMQNSSEFLSGK